MNSMSTSTGIVLMPNTGHSIHFQKNKPIPSHPYKLFHHMNQLSQISRDTIDMLQRHKKHKASIAKSWVEANSSLTCSKPIHIYHYMLNSHSASLSYSPYQCTLLPLVQNLPSLIQKPYIMFHHSQP